MSYAAQAIAKMYGMEFAQQHFNFDAHPHLRQTSTLEQYALDFGTELSNFNKGAMSQLQQNPDDTDAQCYIDTAATNVEILVMVDFTAYYTSSFDVASFIELAKVMQLALMAQFESCSFINFLISLDGFLSNVPAAVAGGFNMATQLGVGYGNGNQDTSIFLAIDMYTTGWADDRNWETIGKATLLLLSQLLKVSADGSIEVSPTGA